MATYKMSIELRSGMCCGTGETDGVGIDNVTTIDDFGFPYIPGNSLKGLLREQMLIVCPEHAGELFGLPGSESPGKLTFENARLDGYNEILTWVTDPTHPIASPLVEQAYTTTHTSTAIEDDGVVKVHTLRTVELVKAAASDGTPTKFTCLVGGNGLDDSERDAFNRAVKCLRAIGMNKSRGFGEVVCSGEWVGDEDASSEPIIHVPTEAGAMRYRIVLDAPCVVRTGSNDHCDYIPGSVMQGVFARELSADREFLINRLLRKTRFSNAYVEAIGEEDGSGMPTFPVPFSFRAEKNAEGIQEGGVQRMRLYDASSLTRHCANGEESIQQVSIDGYGAWANGDYRVCEARQEMSFHSSGSSSPQGKQLFTMRSLSEGQAFNGAVWGDADMLERLGSIVRQKRGRFTLGAATSGGYGACEISLLGSEPIKLLRLSIGQKVVVHMDSDVVLIDSRGVNVADVKSLMSELSSGDLGISLEMRGDGEMPDKAFLKTCTTGGYNAHWHLPKRQYVAIKKGSVIRATITGINRKGGIPSVGWVGYMQEEGFGQIHIEPVRKREDAGTFLGVSPVYASKVRPSAGGIVDNKNSVRSLRRELAYIATLDRLLHAAYECASDYKLNDVSISGAMRVASLVEGARKAFYEQDVESADDIFANHARDSFSDEKSLLTACNAVVEAYKRVSIEGDDSKLLVDKQKTGLFWLFIGTYTHRLRQLYTLERKD